MRVTAVSDIAGHMRGARAAASYLKEISVMRQAFALAVVIAGLPSAAFGQQQPVLRCYGVETEIGIVARRDYFDDRGFVIKEVQYRSNDRTGARTCADDMLRVYSIKTITRDDRGRSLVETELSPAGEVERIVRHEYIGDSREPSRDIWSAPNGTRRYEIRRAPGGSGSQLYYDSRGLVVGVMGSPPTDVQYALRWGTELDGWSCGVTVENGLIYVHLKNGTEKEVTASFTESFQTELRDTRGSIVPLLPAFAARLRTEKSRGISKLIGPHETAFYIYQLEPRYGRLPEGHYSLAVWHPHPTSGIMLLSNRYEFDIK